MGYSVFQNTMVDMTYPQIEEAIENGACALLPISVVEEHGPHLCTGTDIYLTEAISEKIKFSLNEKEIPVLIAPPFFWGINSITNDFVGSFSISSNIMERLLLEILENLHKWGIEKIFMLNFHGDFVHIKKIADIAQKAFEELKIEAYFVNSKSTFMQCGLIQEAPYLLHVPLDLNGLSLTGDNYIDIHAGASETSWMLLDYAGLVDSETAKQQRPTDLSIDELKIWLHGGKKAKELTPLEYCGNPADIELNKIMDIEHRTVEAFTNCIIKSLL